MYFHIYTVRRRYVGIMQDTISSQKHLVLIRSMGELDKNAIAKRLGKFSRCDLSE